jgi:O-antigen ligase
MTLIFYKLPTIIRKSPLLDRIYYISVCLIFITLPYDIHYNSIAIIFMGVIWLLRLNWYRRIKKIFNIYFFMFSALYVMHIIGLLWTQDFSEGLLHIERKLTLVVLPLIFTVDPILNKKAQKWCMLSFVISCLAAVLICYANLLIINFNEFNFNFKSYIFLTNHNFSKVINIHATYFSIYILFSLMILCVIFYKEISNTTTKILFFLIAVLFLCTLFVLGSRMIILLSTTLILLGLVYVYNIRRSFKAKIILTVFTVLMLAGLYLSPYVKNRFNQMLNIELNDLIGSNKENGITQRIFVWVHSIPLLKEAPLLGYGTGDVPQTLNNAYLKIALDDPELTRAQVRALKRFSEMNLNAHNQYLQIILSLGLVGLLILLSVLALSLNSAVKTGNVLFLAFICIVVFCFLTESMLNTQKGVVFFSLISSFFLFNCNDNSLAKRNDLTNL